MAGLKKTSILRQSSYNSLYTNPLIDRKTNEIVAEVAVIPLENHLSLKNSSKNIMDCKENDIPILKSKKVSNFTDDKENLVPKMTEFCTKKQYPDGKSLQNCKERALKPSSLQLCIQMNEPDSSFGFGFGFKVWDAAEETESAKSVNMWDYSDSEAAPASSWSTLPNRALLCRPLPMDVGRCTCIIIKEAAPQGFRGGSLYSLYTNEGQGRQNRKLAVAYHKRRSGRSVFIIAQNTKGVLSTSDGSFVGLVSANLMGSRYYVWNKGRSPRTRVERSRLLEAIVEFALTIATWTGRHRSLRAWISKQQPQSTQSKNTTNNQVQNVKGLPSQWWEGKMDQDQVHCLSSRVPHYNKISKKYELDFREKVRAGLRIQSSVKNIQLTMEEGQGRQNRKLAVAYHKRRSGRSVFIIAQNTKGVLSTSDGSFVGLVSANLMGSRYYVWNKGRSPRTRVERSRLLEAIVEFAPTIATWTGRHRSLRAWISKQQPQSTQSKNTTNNQVQNVKGLPSQWWEGKMDQDQVHCLSSRVPHYNKISKKYELDFREKVRAGLRIQSSVKNIQLTMEGSGGQTILQLGRLGKSKFVLDYRHPLTGYQAFCICLASIDPKLCCTV